MPLIELALQAPGRALRSLRRSPAYALTGILLLGMGIGAGAIAIDLFRIVVLAPLPYVEPSELVRVRESSPPRFSGFAVAQTRAEYWRDHARAVTGLALFRQTPATLGGDRPVALVALEVNEGFFGTLGASMQVGRGFPPGAGPDSGLVVLGHSAWQRHWSGDPNVVGETVQIEDAPYLVAGVLAPQHDAPFPDVDTYLLGDPLRRTEGQAGVQRVQVIARLAQGVSHQRAQQELASLSQAADEAAGRATWIPALTPLLDDVVGPARERLLLVSSVVGLLLLTVLANVSALALVRTAGRLHDFALHRVLGASSLRVAGGIWLELALLGLGGGLLGALLAALGSHALRGALTGQLPRIESLTPSLTLLPLCLFSGLVLASVASAFATRLCLGREPQADLQAGGRGQEGEAGGRLRRALVIGKIALAFLLMTGAVLLVQSHQNLSAIDPGFRMTDRHILHLALPTSRYPDPSSVRAFHASVREAVGTIPGVEASEMSHALPMLRRYALIVDIEGVSPQSPDQQPSGLYFAGTPGLATSLEIPLQSGRLLSEADDEDAAPVALVSASFVARYMEGRSPLGTRIRMVNEREWREVVGVVGDIREIGPDAETAAQVHAPLAQRPFRDVFLIVSSTMPTESLGATVRTRIKEVDPQLPVAELRPLLEVPNRVLAPARQSAGLVAGLALAGVVLGVMGLHGTLSYSVAMRRRDTGVRQALGARAQDELRRIVVQGVRLALAGSMVGALLAVAGSRLIASFVYGVSTTDVATLAGVGLAIVCASTVAALHPALVAARTDPATALRGPS